MGKLLPAFAVVFSLGLAAHAEEKAKQVEFKGKLQTGIVAIGGETTGTIIRTKKGAYELDLGKNKELRAKAKKLNGKTVVVKGKLTIRKGVEVKVKRIIQVSSIREARE